MKLHSILLLTTLPLVAISACKSAEYQHSLDSVQAPPDSRDAGQVVYVQSNNIEENANSILAFRLGSDGSLEPLAGSPFPTRGTGIDNDTNGKLGPNDNDTPIAVDASGTRLFAVNGHSDTIAVMDIKADGSLRHVDGSPFPSRGVGPVSLAIAGDTLLVAHRNEDPSRLAELAGAASGSYSSFRIGHAGRLTFLSEFLVPENGKPTQVLTADLAPGLVFGNDFQVDADFDGDGGVSKLFGKKPSVQGGLHSFRMNAAGELSHVGFTVLPETADPAPDVPSIPLGLVTHPGKRLIYAGFVTRNELGVFDYDTTGSLTFRGSVPNSGQDICWLTTNDAGTRLYAVNNLPRAEIGDRTSTVTVFDISGARAERPAEIQRIALAPSHGTFVNNRNMAQPNSAAFQVTLDASENFLFVVNQRVDQSGASQSKGGNGLHVLRVDADGMLSTSDVLDLGDNGVAPRSRPQGVVCVPLR